MSNNNLNYGLECWSLFMLIVNIYTSFKDNGSIPFPCPFEVRNGHVTCSGQWCVMVTDTFKLKNKPLELVHDSLHFLPTSKSFINLPSWIDRIHCRSSLWPKMDMLDNGEKKIICLKALYFWIITSTYLIRTNQFKKYHWYGLNVCFPRNFICWISNPWCDGFGRWRLGKVNKQW